jgi:hypothetical protein
MTAKRQVGATEASRQDESKDLGLLQVYSNYGSYEEFIWSFFPFYALDLAGHLRKSTKLEITQEAKKYGQEDWHQIVELALDVRPDFLKSVYKTCIDEGMTEVQALLCVRQGFDFQTENERLWERERFEEIIMEQLAHQDEQADPPF